ncbi:pilus assembly protein [Microbulbifer sp. ANSA005]|uniref:pilus assembly protein n=1 Tax=Microbulbifer sp. ANSA005 TaxID=3243362 RepID=UPI00404159A3
MISLVKKLKSASTITAAFLSLGISHSAVSIDFSQQPLFLSTSVDPNIMFILDDSGSMQFEVTPSEITDYFYVPVHRRGRTYNDSYPVRYTFPQTEAGSSNSAVRLTPCPYNSSSTSGCDYWNGSNDKQTIAKFDSDNKWAAYYRSSYNNKSYYDPTILYLPWAEEDENGNEFSDANPQKAYHNPYDTSKGWRNLTVNNTQSANCWIKNSATKGSSNSSSNLCESGDLTFYPATYFNYKGTVSSDVYLSSSYDRIQIKNDGSTYAGGSARTDCADSSACTYAEEIQNFANWYSYHRSRVLMSRAGIGHAFSAQGEGLRVGFGTLNTGSKTIDGYSTDVVLEGVRTFKDTDRENFFERLYGTTIPSEGTPLLNALEAAGKYYSRTDSRGPWSSTPGESGSTSSDIACRSSYTILMTDGYGNDYGSDEVSYYGNVDGAYGAPFSDSYANTLADIAMHYWKTDLNTNLSNSVNQAEGSIDTATWQHMVTFGVALGVTGNVDPTTAFNAIDTSTAISWGDPDPSYTDSNINANKLDDLLHASLNSRGGFYSASDSKTFADQLTAVLSNISGRAGSSSAVAANSTRLGTDTLVFQALFDSNDWSGEVKAFAMDTDGDLSDTPKWSTSSSGKIPTSGRTILTYDGSDTVSFTWNNLTDKQKSALIGTDSDSVGEERLEWLWGKSISGMRSRTYLLGDVVNSSPALADNKDMYYSSLPTYLGGDKYASYLSDTKEARSKEILYVSANDGMLHGLNSATGVEEFAYIPSGAYEKLADLTETDYGTESNPHEYIVDGPLYVSDAYFKKGASESWRNILVGTYGAGSEGLFVLDVTNPSSPEVLFELDSSDDDSIGNIIGQPLIAPTPAGWKLIFGNGYNSDNDAASLVIVDLADPSDIEVLEAGSSTNNGLAGPSLLPDIYGIVRAAYAGDIYGNMWKFDLSSESESSWKVAFGSDSSPEPLFTANDINGRPQPITAAPVLGANSKVDNAIMVYFGTGSYLSSADDGEGDVVHTFYGIVDNDTNITSTDRSELFEKTISESSGSRTINGDSDTSWWDTKKGWYLDFGAVSGSTVNVTGERIISKPLLIRDRLIFPTLTPSKDPCAYGATGWTMELIGLGDPRFANESILDEPNTKEDSATIAFSDVIIAGKKVFIPYSDTSGSPVDSFDGALERLNDRLSWRQP